MPISPAKRYGAFYARWRFPLVCVLFVLISLGAEGQFMRLGPFDVDVTATLDAIYSSNVDQARPSEADKEMSDYWLLGRLSFDARAELTKNPRASAGFSLEQEKHFHRSDLDDRKRSDPFGRGDLSTDLEFGRYTLDFFICTSPPTNISRSSL